MIRWIIIIIIAFLLIDHLWVHIGGRLVEKIREENKEITKKSSIEKTEVPLQQAYRKSILDNIWERLNNTIKDIKKEGGK